MAKDGEKAVSWGEEVKIMPDTELEAVIRERNHTEEEKINLREVKNVKSDRGGLEAVK